LGESDPMRALQMQPGVQSGNEGARGIFIRGGSPDQTLMLLDGAPVYNPAHIYGFISVFNGDAIDKMSVYKDRYPARFGGRLCSVIDIGVDDGDTGKLNGTFSLGLVTSRININGPIGKKKKTTFAVSARGCYVGLYTGPISKRQYKATGFDGRIAYYFGDVNAKLVHRFNNKTKLALNFFTNNDYYSFKRGFESGNAQYTEKGLTQHDIQWANYVASAALVHVFDQAWQMKQHFSFSRYQIVNDDHDDYQQTSSLGAMYSYSNSTTQSYINDFTWQEDATYQTTQQTFMMGAGVTTRMFETGKGQFSYNTSYGDSMVNKLDGTLIKSLEAFVYAEDEYHPDEHWLINGGFHVRVYVVDKKAFASLLPRVNVLYNPAGKFYLRASASGLSQNIHLLATSSSNILNDYWVPATQKVKPENGWNFSAGMTQKLPLNFEWSIDGFYRIMNNVVEYKDGASQNLYTPWEDQVIGGGKGRSYGTEVYVARTKGKITGSVSYTLSWSERKFASLSNNEYFPYKYDRRHNLAAQLTFLVGRHFELGAAYVYGSGNMFSIPGQSYHTFGVLSAYDYWLSQGQNSAYTNDLIGIYPGRNNARLPSYQHLDLSFTYRKQVKRLQHAFNFSVYNVYNHYNIFAVYSDYRTNDDGSRSLVYKKLSLFPILPSVSYTVKFS
ncbi:MAG TPA: TonB-dependent receptor plug domain-containing protein, partial [Chitinophagales bacterium]|nr:TonB-dependent receptor plug domain-containing protein [Chitinophagales bacterium]